MSKKIITALLLLFSLHDYVAAQQKPVDLVYPQLDAAHSRWFYFSSACRPFGMVSLFPDTKTGDEWGSGYRYTVDTVRCFSHIHEWQLSGVAVMPVVFDAADMNGIFSDHASHFSHEQEEITPGYHSVILDRYNIKAELTASQRVGFHRYEFPISSRAGVVMDLGGHLGPSDILEGGFEKISDYEVRGFMVNGPTVRRVKKCPVYFSMKFDRPIKNIYLAHQDSITMNVARWTGKHGKILIDLGAGGTVMMKAGVSFVSEQGAAANSLAEIPRWDFDKVADEARDTWNTMLGRIAIKGGTLQQQRRFYTDLWHAIQGRRVISDADGHYADHTGAEKVIRRLPLDQQGRAKFNMYNSDAFWGAQWTLNTLWQLVYPEIAEEFCNSFVEYYKNGGFIPRGPSGGSDTFVMTGASSTPFFVSAWQKGIRNFDIDLAYEGLRKNHMSGGLMGKAGYEHFTAKGGGIEFYMEHGYVPYPLSATQYGFHQDGAGMTMEYAYQDWTLAQLAKALNKKEDHRYFLKRSENYKNLFNQKSRYIQPKDSLGHWTEPFDPLLYDHGYIEGNAAHFSWFVPHDLPGLFTLLGGKDSAVARLNWQFEQASAHRFCNEHPEKDPKFVNDKRTWINYSNQPNSHAAFIFNHAGAPWLTQYWSREIVNKAFSELSPMGGYNGDEDQGLMGSLSVLMKIGIFQMTGGCEEDPAYEIGSPLFDEVVIQLHPAYYKGKSFTIRTIHNSNSNRYIQSMKLNGKQRKTLKLRHSEIVKGADLELWMNNKQK
jgi:predicted alpha-1,2-mannosidase